MLKTKRYGYEKTNFSYLVNNPFHTSSHTFSISLLSDTISTHPQQFFDVVGIPKRDVAMTKEYSSLLKNSTYNLVPLPKEHKLDHCKWIYRTKYVVDGSVNKHKTHHVVNGFL